MKCETCGSTLEQHELDSESECPATTPCYGCGQFLHHDTEMTKCLHCKTEDGEPAYYCDECWQSGKHFDEVAVWALGTDCERLARRCSSLVKKRIQRGLSHGL